MLFSSIYGGFMKTLVNLINMLYDKLDIETNWEIEINKAITALLKAYCTQSLKLTKDYEVVITDLNRERTYGYTYGVYRSSTKQVLLDRSTSNYVEYAIDHKINTLFSIVETTLHEFRHAWQFEGNMEIPKNYVHGDTEETFKEYENQPIEKDARNWASRQCKDACEYVADNLVQYLMK